jgi:hypothetical protein
MNESKDALLNRLKDALQRIEPKSRDECVELVLGQLEQEERRQRLKQEFESLKTEQMEDVMRNYRKTKAPIRRVS